jgi:mannose-6-phosphate isomerase
MQKIFPLKGTMMQYAWGGSEFLPRLLRVANPEHRPYAEYWLGAHTSSSSQIEKEGISILLRDAINKDPLFFLGEKVYRQFEGLPFLLKVLDVSSILSIQVHPTMAQAREGFDREEAAGIPLDAPHRNYKDRNHKPEMLVALSDFWLLHGFKSPESIVVLLEDVPEFNQLKPLFLREGLAAVYQMVMEMSDEDSFHWLLPLVKRELRKKREGLLKPSDPGWWVARLYETEENMMRLDKALFSIYLMNIVHLDPMESLFQGAGQPHAYLQGQCVELMSNSDNVLRAGLTNKHIDVPELIRLTKFETTLPQVRTGQPVQPGEDVFLAPINDFSLSSISLEGGNSFQHETESPEIYVVISGNVTIGDGSVYQQGEAFYVCPGTAITLTSEHKTSLFRAFVP